MVLIDISTKERFTKSKCWNKYGQDNVWFQYDDATAHTTHRSLNILREMFLRHIVSLCGDIGWLPRSPNLNPWDFFLLRFLKNQLYQYRPQIVEDLKKMITHEFAAIPPEMTRKFFIENYRKILNQSIQNGSRHWSYVIKTVQIKWHYL